MLGNLDFTRSELALVSLQLSLEHSLGYDNAVNLHPDKFMAWKKT